MIIMELYNSKKLIEKTVSDTIEFNTKQLININTIYRNTEDEELRKVSFDYMVMLWNNLKEITIKKKLLHKEWQKLV